MPELILPTITIAGILAIIGLQFLNLAVLGALHAQLQRLTPRSNQS